MFVGLSLVGTGRRIERGWTHPCLLYSTTRNTQPDLGLGFNLDLYGALKKWSYYKNHFRREKKNHVKTLSHQKSQRERAPQIHTQARREIAKQLKMLKLIAAAPHCRTPGGKKRSFATTKCNSISYGGECSHGLGWPARGVDRIYNAREVRKERTSPWSQRLPFCVSQEMKR